MSVQLILYPQAYNGLYNSYSVPYFNEHLGNPKFNSGFVFTANSPLAIANFYGHNPVNRLQAFGHGNASWSSWYTDGSTSPTTTAVFGAVSAPTISNGEVTFHSTASGADGFDTGIYQRVQNLTVGVKYNLKIQILEATSGTLTIGQNINWQYNFLANGAGVHPCILSNQITPTVGTRTFTFTATASTQMLVLRYTNSVAHDLVLGEVSIKENIDDAPTVDAYTDGQVILDLYEESNLPLTLSIDNFKNVAEKTQSFSKAFKLPSTKRNNKIFNNIFEVTKSVQDDIYAFNPYKKTKAILKEDGYTVFDGFLRLIDITNKEGEVSYNVNLYSDTITLADTLKDKTLANLVDGFEELTHLYNKTNIKATFGSTGVTYTSSATSGFRAADTVKYPLCDWNGNITLDSSNNPVLQFLEDGYRPWLNCKYLVDRIIAEAGFTYTSTFLSSTDFTKLFMDFNWGSDNEIITGNGSQPCSSSLTTAGLSATATSSSYQPFQLDQSAPFDVNFPSDIGYNNTTHKFVCPADNTGYKIEYWHNTRIYNNTTYSGRWKHTSNATGAVTYYDSWSAAQSANVTVQGSGTVYIQCNENDEIVFEHKTTGAGHARQSNFTGVIFGVKYIVTIGQTIATSNNLLQSMRGNIKQWDLLKGFVTMFNLVILKDKDNPTNFIIEPYKDIFIDNSDIKTHDWTTKVDIEETNLKPIDLKKTVSFNYKEDKDDHAKNIYEKATTNKYGDYEIAATSFNLLQGETKIETIFGATYIKPLFDSTSEIVCPAIYKGKEDGTFEGYENNPRICYDNGSVSMVSHTIYLPVQNGVTSENSTQYLQFSHLSEIPTTSSTKDYNFGASQFILGIGNAPVDNLYNTYWSPYYDELYNSDTRTLTLKLYLTPSEISNFNFYDTVRIKNSLYRVNKIDYKPYEMSTVEFILIA